MNRLLDGFFTTIYFLMRLSMLHLILSLCGGVIFGVAPANATLFYLYGQHKREIQSYQLQEAWTYYKKQFLPSNVVFAACLVGGLLLISGFWLLLQFSPSIWTLLGMICECLMLSYLFMLYVSFLKLQSHYEFSLKTGIKLAAISVFVSWKVVFKVLGGSLICGLLLYKLPLVLVVFLPIIWLLFIYDVTEPLHQKVEEQYQ